MDAGAEVRDKQGARHLPLDEVEGKDETRDLHHLAVEFRHDASGDVGAIERGNGRVIERERRGLLVGGAAGPPTPVPVPRRPCRRKRPGLRRQRSSRDCRDAAYRTRWTPRWRRTASKWMIVRLRPAVATATPEFLTGSRRSAPISLRADCRALSTKRRMQPHRFRSRRAGSQSVPPPLPEPSTAIRSLP